MAITRQTDVDLAGQVETRQSTSGFMLCLDGALIHWRGRTERRAADQMTIIRQTDVDLAGQVETRQSTRGFTLCLDEALIHWRGRTE